MDELLCPQSVITPLCFPYFDFVGTGTTELCCVTAVTAAAVVFTGAPPVDIAVQTSSVVLAGAADWGVNTGTVTVHLLHVVMVSVVRKVEVLVMVSMEVFPFLVCVVVVGGQSVTVV